MKKRIQNILDYIVYLIVRVFICVIQSVSMDVCERASHFLAILFTDFIPIRSRLLHDNLSHAFPEYCRRERKRLIRKMWVHLFLMISEVAHAPRQFHGLNWWDHIDIENAPPFFSALQENRPIILITGHFGNFEMGGYILGLLGYPTFSVARKLDNPYLNDFISTFRGQTGQYIIDKNEGFEDIVSVMEHKGIMAFLADQSAGARGAWVDFFGRPASAYKSMALLSIQYDAPMFVCFATRRDDKPMRFTMRMVEKLDPRSLPRELRTVKQITQWYATKTEEQIRLAPHQYWWLHNRWKTYGKKFDKI